MTNEQYLHISYFAVAGAGAALAGLVAIILARPHRQATQGPILPQLARFLRRVFPSWLVLIVLLAFMTVSYMECRTYEQVVADRDYLIDKTQEQLYRMSVWLAVALTIYAVVLMLFLWARAIVHRHHNRLQNQQPLPKGPFD